MKFWTIFAIYLLFLSALPCADRIECNDVAKTEITTTENHQDHKHETENCSPFCICACCGISVTQFNPTVFTSKKVIYFPLQKNYSYYKLNYSSIDFCNIWQPPKLS